MWKDLDEWSDQKGDLLASQTYTKIAFLFQIQKPLLLQVVNELHIVLFALSYWLILTGYATTVHVSFFSTL